METLALSLAEELLESAQWDDPAPPNIEEEEFDIMAFELWQRGSLPELAGEQEMEIDEALGSRASCL